jgi:hypothetical protein
MYVIQIPQSIQEFFIDMVKSAKYEILLILPTVNAFLRITVMNNCDVL